MNKCCICHRSVAPDEIAVRIVVEAVSRQDNEGEDAAYWEKIEDWEMVHLVHLSCAATENNKGFAFEFGEQLNELPLDELVEKFSQPEVIHPPLKLVQGGNG